jgi:hypothetical protein
MCKLSIQYDTFLDIALFPSGSSICVWNKWLCKPNTKTRFLFLSLLLPISDLEIERIGSQVQYHNIHSSKIFLIYNLRKFLWIIHKLTKLLSGKCGWFSQSHIAVQPNKSNWLLFMRSEVLGLPIMGCFGTVYFGNRVMQKITNKEHYWKLYSLDKDVILLCGLPSSRIM